MRNFKSLYFFETLLQLTLLANVFRDNLINNNNNINNNYLSIYKSDFFINNNSSLIRHYLAPRNYLFNNLLNYTQLSIKNLIYNRKLVKSNNLHHLNIIPNNNILFVAPASFVNNNNQKDLIQPSETRLLLNSIALNANQLSKVRSTHKN